jgi:hypothetical protein
VVVYCYYVLSLAVDKVALLRRGLLLEKPSFMRSFGCLSPGQFPCPHSQTVVTLHNKMCRGLSHQAQGTQGGGTTLATNSQPERQWLAQATNF